MSLTASEKSWLPWWGNNGCWRLGWSCVLNRHRYSQIEEVFTGIAQSRKKLLLLWFTSRWAQMQSLADRLDADALTQAGDALREWCAQDTDFTELFIIDPQGKLLASSVKTAVTRAAIPASVLSRGLAKQFLHGPYSDPVTKHLGASSSKFHDAMTLMFYQPLPNGKGCLCGRIPNDVMSDVLQREDGHVYRDSGDNYLFMAKAEFDPTIAPGTALSRSRFEDRTFSLGDNLKEGVKTAYGTVSVKEHTELELRFTDPATRELHPGVRETIRQRENLFVTYPGYSDYRHIPVIGKGITFTVPGSQDQWGMMCEGDLEEVYRRRSLGYTLAKRTLFASAVVVGAGMLGVKLGWLASLNPVLILSGWTALFAAATSVIPAMRRLDDQTKFLLSMVECGASLKQRLDWDSLKADEVGELGRWVNSFVDKIDDTVERSLEMANRVGSTSSNLTQLATQVSSGSRQQTSASQLSVDAINELAHGSNAMTSRSDAAETITREARQLSDEGTKVICEAMAEMSRTSTAIDEMAGRVDSLDRRAEEINRILVVIKAIADQTNLLALNAAIEAARAGEQGRGFSVVADEVRSLASRTAESTSEISDMIGGVQNETRAAVSMMQQCQSQVVRSVELVNQANESLANINQGSNKAATQITEIAQAARDQLTTGNRISTQVQTIAGLAETNNTQAQKALMATRELDHLARNLLGVVSKFTL